MRIEDRFMSKVKKTSSCWEWTASTIHSGYGRFSVEGKMLLAHRVSFDLFTGTIPPGYFVCHTCDSPGCVNPDHLFLVTAQDNTDDTISKGRQVVLGPPLDIRSTQCKHGHRYTDKNTYLAITKAGNIHRTCRECKKNYYAKNSAQKIKNSRDYREKNKEEISQRRKETYARKKQL